MSAADTESVNDFLSIAVPAGRNAGPGLLLEWVNSDRPPSAPALRASLIYVWEIAEFPQAILTVAVWTALFRRADYRVPDEIVTLYRGATIGRARGMSWTDDRSEAEWFARRFARFAGTEYVSARLRQTLRPAYVYSVEAPPEAILFHYDTEEIAAWASAGRSESEVIVDPRMLPAVRRVVR